MSADNQRNELMTRWSLIRKVSNAECDEASWAEFYGLYRKLIYAVACKAGLNHEESEDVVQETMRSVCENIRDFKPDPAHGSFKGWLLKTARWRITDQFRKRQVHSPGSTSPQLEQSRTSTIERIADPASLNLDEVWAQEWQKKMFDMAVERVRPQASPQQFQIFDFYVLRQMPVDKVTRSLGVSVARVYLARHRILKLVKQELKVLERKMG